ncbi:MAG: assimilatory sulfite reductase (NADPH) flavoprotein subunit [Gammaproteobacteria bacterium]|nr:assimilatory sulfite reductase (NADPH) flavoprotein subunit [Gammaproteobacteria bacterium]
MQTEAYPLDATRVELLSRLVKGLDASTLQWLSGYAAGLASARGDTLRALPAAEPDVSAFATIVHGSQTGNGRRVAEALVARLKAQGIQTRLIRAGEYPLRELARERRLFVVMSTHGDGDPPDDAMAFTDFLFSRRVPQLPSLEFAVLALGDSSYPKYCEIGRRIDERLGGLGATRLFERVDCDVDFETGAADWSARAFAFIEQVKPIVPAARVATLRPVAVAAPWSRERPFTAELLANQRITIGNHVRDVRHIELSLAGSGLHYEPGDALGVVAENPPQSVEAVLSAARLTGSEPVERHGKARDLAGWLRSGLEITRVTKPLIGKFAERSGSAELAALLRPGNEAGLREFMTRTQLVDLLVHYPSNWDAAALAGSLRPLVPRLYSIASSAKEVGDEVHLTVARLDSGGGSTRPGAASHFIATRADAAQLSVYVEPNPRFRLPADTSRDVIMIGPGTGVAPYRGFLQERAATGAAGRNWLVFGARHFANDFLYQIEWQRALKRGLLTRLDLAFSRDGGLRVYVQQRLAEAGRELYDWIESGASIYVCGDATHMAPDVHAALASVIERHGALSAEAARERLNRLGADGRYLRDVY